TSAAVRTAANTGTPECRTDRCGAGSVFFNAAASAAIYTLSLHDALPISRHSRRADATRPVAQRRKRPYGHIGERRADGQCHWARSEEHTSELQSRGHLVCRLLLEKKKKIHQTTQNTTTPPLRTTHCRCNT